jgi:hypothetical protein
MRIPLNAECIASLIWWNQINNLTKGISMGTADIDCYLFTDSSNVGWGAHVEGHTASGIWPISMRDLHINVLELNAVWLGLQSLIQHIQGCNVALMCDTMATVAYLRNQGGTKSLEMCNLALRICKWMEIHSINLIPRHICGTLNVLADSL